MLFTKEFKAGIRAGKITRSYRAWKRPQAKPGTHYNLAPDGIIEVQQLSLVRIGCISDPDARAAGFDDAAQLLAYLKQPAAAEVYRVDFRYLGPGLVRQPDRQTLNTGELNTLITRLTRMDARAESSWTGAVLELIRRQPGTRAGDLAPLVGWDTATFKRQVRKLKGLGLTVSLETGYCLSPRGEQLYEVMSGR